MSVHNSSRHGTRRARPLQWLVPLICGLLVASTASTAIAQLTAEPPQSWLQKKLLPANGKEGDRFGTTVAIDALWSVVGAPGTSLSSPMRAGAAYIFDNHTGQELFQLTPSDLADGDEFGTAVASDTLLTIAGSPRHDRVATNAGAAYVFDPLTGHQIHKLVAGDAAMDDEFGTSVGISIQNSTAIVGAPFDDHMAGVDAGSAYLFDTGNGSQQFKLTASDAGIGHEFGHSTAINATTAIVGAPLADAPIAVGSGSAYLFDASTGMEQFKLSASDAAAFDQFGWSVASDGNYAIVGAPGKSGSALFAGAAYVYDVTTGQELFKLTASDATAVSLFGWSVDISGGMAVIGARLADNPGLGATGAAYIFDMATGRELHKLRAADAAAVDSFGASVSISTFFGPPEILVGAPGNNDNEANSGSAYQFRPLPMFVAVPEPSSLLLAGMALAGCCWLGRRRKDG